MAKELDLDPQETQEWIESLESVLEREGPELFNSRRYRSATDGMRKLDLMELIADVRRDAVDMAGLEVL